VDGLTHRKTLTVNAILKRRYGTCKAGKYGMKTNQIFLIALVATLSAAAQGQAQNSGSMAFKNLDKAGNIIGMVITDSRNQRVGKVKDLAVDMQGGSVAEVLVDTGGFLTSKQRIIAVPPQSLNFANSGQGLRLSADIDTFDNAPEFGISSWDLSTASSSVMDVYRRFHVQPNSNLGELAPASKIVGQVAENEWTQRMGKVQDLVVDLPSGQMPVVIIASSGFLGIKGPLTAVPPQAFLYDAEYNILILDTTKKALRNAPHFKANEWRYGVNNSLSPSAIQDGLLVLRSLNTNSSDTSEADTQGDNVITLEIEHKILAADGLSMDARHVLVTTLNGRVTLRGIADTEKEKQQLSAIAASVVPIDRVDNRIEVKVFAVATAL